MEFAVVNNYMGPVATKAMKGYSDEDLREAIDDFKVNREETGAVLAILSDASLAKLIAGIKQNTRPRRFVSDAISFRAARYRSIE